MRFPRKRLWLIGGAPIVLLVIAAFVGYLLLRGDAPPEVDLASANAQLDADLAAASSTTTTTSEPDAGDEGGDETTTTTAAPTTTAPTTTRAPFDGVIEGTWVVDDEIGDFAFESASGSFAGFRVREELGEVTVVEVTAVGRSGAVTGALTIEDGVLTAAEIIVDMTVIASDDSRRETAIANAVGARDFPTATFVLTESVDLPGGLAEGEKIAIEAVGELTIKGTTNTVVFTIDALVRPDGLGVVVGSTDVIFGDYGVDTPTSPIVFALDDFGVVEFQLIVDRR